MQVFPKLMFWAWERPEDLRQLNVKQAGVAYLARTITVHGRGFRVAPRLQPLHVPAGTALMAVTRIEVARGEALDPDDRLVDGIVAAVLGDLPRSVAGVQIDFDAKVSERAFYRGLLVELRRRMAPGMPLSMTSLASWALFDDWMAGLPVDEAVPMCFDMGADGAAVRAHLDAGRDFLAPLARHAIGLRLDEARPKLPGSRWDRRRVYLFQHAPWTDRTLHQALQEFTP
jgi:hypothetical protein